MPPVKILVVDDEIELQRLIRQRFRKRIQAQELDFLFALNGVEALRLLQETAQISHVPVDIVLTDLNMPQMDGLTFINRLSEIDETLKAVVISAYADIPKIREAMNQGAFDFLTKPIDFQDLEITLQKTLETVRQARARQQQIQETQAALFKIAYCDPLTGLSNRARFIQQIGQLLQPQPSVAKSAAPAPGCAVLFIDLDRFKRVNDSLGSAIGDLLLQQVAARLQACLLAADPIAQAARLGSDEFAILMPRASEGDAIELAQRVQQQMTQPFTLEGLEIFSQASIGITLAGSNGLRPEDLLRDADVAMRTAKAQGMGHYAVFDPRMQLQLRESLLLETDLRWAIDRAELSLHYQPILTATGQLYSFEVLLRWQHSTRGQIAPAQFMPIAEETQLILPVSSWIVETACRQLHLWHQRPAYADLKLNLNFSAVQLQQPQIVEQIREILEATGLEGRYLNIEITENYLLENIPARIEILRRLKSLGIQICIDDFGTGYSSLGRLHQVPIDILKIDRSFIHRIDANPGRNIETARMVMTLASSFGMTVIAEGVETAAQLQKLQEIGCNLFQGFLISHPLSGRTASLFLEQRNYPL